MTISVYASPESIQPEETYEWQGTLLSFFDAHGLKYTLAEIPKSYVTVNGIPLSIHDWATYEILASDDVKMTFIPFGGVFNALGSILGGLLGFVFGFLMPSNKADTGRGRTEQGQKLDAASGKANTAKLNEVVPECAGTFRRYVDYLTGPRRYFENRRAQMLEFHACVGVGHYQIDRDSVKIADTPFDSLGDNAWFQIYEPNADLTGTSTHQNWYTSPEVGGTSSGTAGLELSTEAANRENTQPASYSFDGSYIWRSSESEFPPGWGAGTIVNITLALQFNVTREKPQFSPERNRFYGDFRHLYPLAGKDISMAVNWGASRTLRVSNSSFDSMGYGWIELSNPGKQTSDPDFWVNDIAPGEYTILFQVIPLARWRVEQYSPDSIAVWRLLPNGNSDPDWLGFPSVTASSATITFNGGTVYGEWSSEFIATPADELTSIIELDYFYPNGLGYINNDGNVETLWSTIEIQYRDARGGPATTVTRSYYDATLDQIGFTERLTIPLMRPAVRTRRVGASATDQQVKDTVQWYGLKANLPTVTRYPRWTTMAVRLRSGGRLAAQSENRINVITQRKLNVLLPDGTWSTDLRPTKDISAWIWYIAKSIGYTQDSINMDELRRLHDLWTARGETYSYVVDLTTVKQAMNSAFASGMAQLSVVNGEIKPVREDVRTAAEQRFAYSPQNMMTPLRRQFKNRAHDENDGVEIEYFDAETFESKTVICKLPDSPGFKLRKVKLNFAATRTFAWRYGMRMARAMRYERWDYSFGTEMDALNSSYGGYVALFDDLVENGQTAQLRSIVPTVGGALLKVTERLKWSEDRYVVGFRRADGLLAGSWEASPGDDDYSVIADIPQAEWPTISLNKELPYIYFAKADRFSFPALITDLSPSNGGKRVSVKAKNYDARIYADDNNFPD